LQREKCIWTRETKEPTISALRIDAIAGEVGIDKQLEFKLVKGSLTCPAKR
jgi:hypothetical protein